MDLVPPTTPAWLSSVEAALETVGVAFGGRGGWRRDFEQTEEPPFEGSTTRPFLLRVCGSPTSGVAHAKRATRPRKHERSYSELLRAMLMEGLRWGSLSGQLYVVS